MCPRRVKALQSEVSNRMKRILIFLLILLTFGGGIYYALHKEKYKVYEVKKKLLVKSVYATGLVKSAVEVEVKSEVAGYIENILKDTGDRVEKGDVLAIIRNEPLKKEIEEIEERIRRVKEKLKQNSAFRKSYLSKIKAQRERVKLLEKKVRRREILLRKELISKETFEEVKTQYETEMHTLKALEEEYKNVVRDLLNELKVLEKKREALRKEYERYLVKSPIDGIILKRNAEVGDYVNTFMETKPLFIVGEEKKVKTLVEVDEEYAPFIRVGQKALIKLEGYPKRVFIGRVKKIYRKIDEKKKTFTIELSVDYDVNVLSGTSVEANLILKEKEGLAIPLKAVEKGYVTLLKNGKKVRVKLKLGDRFGEFVEVLSGLEEGDKILIEEK